MAAFTPKDPADAKAFYAHWRKIMLDDEVIIRTILVNEEIAGHVLSYVLKDTPEISYWLGREYWGKGIATIALQEFLKVNTTRPMYARVAQDNAGSIRVLEKCGFVKNGTFSGYANARGKEIDEMLMVL